MVTICERPIAKQPACAAASDPSGVLLPVGVWSFQEARHGEIAGGSVFQFGMTLSCHQRPAANHFCLTLRCHGDLDSRRRIHQHWCVGPPPRVEYRLSWQGLLERRRPEDEEAAVQRGADRTDPLTGRILAEHHHRDLSGARHQREHRLPLHAAAMAICGSARSSACASCRPRGSRRRTPAGRSP